MKLAECYRLLEVRPGADLEDLKRNFRRLAFSLHPDMNPDDPEAPARFRRLNEAYVRLKREISFSEARRAARKETRQRAESRTADSKTAGEAKPDGSAESATQDEMRQEEVVGDILNDPFARQVFEDIYAQTRKPSTSGYANPGAAQPEPAQPKTATATRKRTLSLEWGKKKLDFDLTGGMLEGAKNWLKSNLDDAQTLHLPARLLQPGSTIRIQLMQGFSDKDALHLDVKLPPDFVVGRPIRLRKLGRKLGPWRGDLYLRLLAKPA